MTLGTLFLGVDGGGTSTDICLAAPDGRVLVSQRFGPANLVSQGVGPTIDALGAAFAKALESVGASPAAIGVAVLGLAGAGRASERASVEGWLATVLPEARCAVVSDAELVLAAGTPAGVGLAVISGTGSVALGRDASGRTVKIGGWGSAIGDPGSAYAIGSATLRSIARHADGLAPETALSDVILGALHLAAGRDLAGARASTEDIAALAVAVSAAADGGDLVAQGILDEAGRDLAEQATSAVADLDWGTSAIPCALGGGVLVHAARVRARFLRDLGGHLPRLGTVTIVERPVDGAIVLAKRLAAGPRL